MATVVRNLADLLDIIRRDLDAIDDSIRWARADGYWPTNATPARPVSIGPPPDDRATDRVPGPRDDFGIGSHRRRQAITAATVDLRQAELWITTAAAIVGHTEPRHLATRHDADAALAAVTAMRPKVDAIAAGTILDCLQWALITASWRLLRARRILDASFREGDDDTRPPVQPDGPNCRICGIRPAAPKEHRTGGRCATCKRYRDRHGYERPRTEDTDGIAGARAAQARRRARGEGWGEA